MPEIIYFYLALSSVAGFLLIGELPGLTADEIAAVYSEGLQNTYFRRQRQDNEKNSHCGR